MTAWRCPTCFEVRLFALTKAQLDSLDADAVTQRVRVSGAMSMSGASEKGQLSLEEGEEDD